MALSDRFVLAPAKLTLTPRTPRLQASASIANVRLGEAAKALALAKEELAAALAEASSKALALEEDLALLP